MRSERGGRFADALTDIGGNVGSALLSNLTDSTGVFQDNTFSDFGSGFFPPEFGGVVDNFRNMNYEDALDARAALQDELETTSPFSDTTQNNMLLPLLLGGGALALIASQSKKKTR